MRFKSVGFVLTVGMALIAVLLGFVLLSAAGLVSFVPNDELAVAAPNAPVAPADSLAAVLTADSAAVQPTAAQTAEIAAGDALFKGNCAQCHDLNENVVGPALRGLTKRRSLTWILPWVKNSSKVVASGDEYAVMLYTKFQRQQMPSFALSDKEIKAIVVYLQAEEQIRPGLPEARGVMIAQD